jgi:hypothetical protein
METCCSILGEDNQLPFSGEKNMMGFHLQDEETLDLPNEESANIEDGEDVEIADGESIELPEEEDVNVENV